MPTVTIKQLHDRTKDIVRRAGKIPLQVTDRGRLVAVLAGPSALPYRKRSRKLLDDYAALLRRKPAAGVQADVDAVRGDR